jgi:hypothetical protein
VLLDVVVGEPVPQLEPGGAQVTLVRVILRVNRLQTKRRERVNKNISNVARTIKTVFQIRIQSTIRSVDPDRGGQK